MKTNELLELSQQELMDCSWPYGNNGACRSACLDCHRVLRSSVTCGYAACCDLVSFSSFRALSLSSHSLFLSLAV